MEKYSSGFQKKGVGVRVRGESVRVSVRGESVRVRA